MRKGKVTGTSGWCRRTAGFALGLVAAFAAPGVRAWTASNAFVVVEAATPVSNAGEGFSVSAPGRVRVEPRRDWVLTAPRGGAGFAAPGRPVAWRAVSVLGEDAAGGTVHVCEFRTETTSDHLRAPALAASCPPVGPFAYARPAEGVDIRISASASQESPGLHRVVTRRLPCPVCGAASGSQLATNLVETSFAAWEWTTPAGALHGPSCAFTLPGVRKGGHAETLSVRASSPDCFLCTAGKSVSAAFTVSELSVSCPVWLGLDRRAGAPGRAEVVAIALLDPEVEGTACDWSVSGICTGEPVPWDGWLLRIAATNDGPASVAYLAERVTATALGATASADFTVVSVEVSIDGEKEGAEGLESCAEVSVASETTVGTTKGLTKVRCGFRPIDLPQKEVFSVSFPGECLKDDNLRTAKRKYSCQELRNQVFSILADAEVCKRTISAEARSAITVNHISSRACDSGYFKLSLYSFTLFVDQPGSGGKRDAYQLSPFDVGHVFWRFNTSCSDDMFDDSVRRYLNTTMGFYPESKPSKSEDENGLLHIPDNDHLARADVVRTWRIDQRSFCAGLVFCREFETNSLMGVRPYNLSAYNCSNAAIDAAGACGIELPRTIGTWPGGLGLNPGDLGEDIRELE